MQLHKLFCGQRLFGLFLKLIDIIFHLQYLGWPDTISLTAGSTEYCLRLLNVAFANNFRPKLLPSRSEDSLGNPFPCIFDHFEARKNVEVLSLKFSENKVGP
ncbi:hypothetical protein AVEN_212747-1 [Araneus ventricosus]|uniref:Uncharacterized protein n=1 Tax=Araneus ventricosus TaxID=182803 RepID=A0A4Y2GZ92_ARAVE|nr:hypothetical protein AVEN_212747-1 [Araneus ventricosus]